MIQFIKFRPFHENEVTINLSRIVDMVPEKRNETSFSYDPGKELMFDSEGRLIAPCHTIEADYEYICMQIELAGPNDRFIQVDGHYREWGTQYEIGTDLSEENEENYDEKYLKIWNPLGRYDTIELRTVLYVSEHRGGHLEASDIALGLIREGEYIISEMSYSVFLKLVKGIEELKKSPNHKGLSINRTTCDLIRLEHKTPPENIS